MKPTLWTPITLLCCLIGCSGPSQADQAREAIVGVLRADKQLSTETGKTLPPSATPSQIAAVMGNYCKGLESMDMSGCPADFRVAMRHHALAWREYDSAVKQLPDGFVEGLWVGALNALAGEADGGNARVRSGVQRAQDRVRDTWIDVEKIGAKYGAVL